MPHDRRLSPRIRPRRQRGRATPSRARGLEGHNLRALRPRDLDPLDRQPRARGCAAIRVPVVAAGPPHRHRAHLDLPGRLRLPPVHGAVEAPLPRPRWRNPRLPLVHACSGSSASCGSSGGSAGRACSASPPQLRLRDALPRRLRRHLRTRDRRPAGAALRAACAGSEHHHRWRRALVGLRHGDDGRWPPRGTDHAHGRCRPVRDVLRVPRQSMSWPSWRGAERSWGCGPPRDVDGLQRERGGPRSRGSTLPRQRSSSFPGDRADRALPHPLPSAEALPGIVLRLVDRIGLDEPYRPGKGAGSKSRPGTTAISRRDRGAAPFLVSGAPARAVSGPPRLERLTKCGLGRVPRTWAARCRGPRGSQGRGFPLR